MLTYLLFILGFVLLIKGADLLVDGASAIARYFRVSDLVIGLTVVAFGTSTPELGINIIASLNGNTDIAIGNVIGSNTANILLILGISSVICPLAVSRGTVWKEIPFSLLAVIVMGLMANDILIDGGGVSELSRIDGLVLLAFFIIFIYYTFGIAGEVEGISAYVPASPVHLVKYAFYILIGLAGLTIGGKWIVDGAVVIGKHLGLSESLIGLTVVAVGTSLPELATSAVAAFRKNADIAVGNVVGSNIFNVFFVLGISATIKPLPFKPQNNIDIGVSICAGFLLFLFMFSGRKQVTDRWEGVIFILSYIAYIAFLILSETTGFAFITE